jgi:hypothetical protein
MRRTYLFALAVLVAAFVALYPYWGAVGMCDLGDCPPMVHSASGGFSAACCLIVAALAAAPTMRAVSKLLVRGAAPELRPVQVFSSPDPPPPRSYS